MLARWCKIVTELCMTHNQFAALTISVAKVTGQEEKYAKDNHEGKV
jgi:hypothetical protein